MYAYSLPAKLALRIEENEEQNSKSNLNPVAHAMVNYLEDQLSPKAYSSKACKGTYKQLPEARKIIARFSKLRDVVT